MKHTFFLWLMASTIILSSCTPTGSERPPWLSAHKSDPIQGDSLHREAEDDNKDGDTLPAGKGISETVITGRPPIARDAELAKKIVEFGQTLLGTPYKYASADPAEGFDCSGYLYYVFEHYGIDVPRSSAGYLSFGETIDPLDVKPGDFLVFTGTDSTIREPGHVGLVIKNDGDNNIEFIHASSGKANGVTISPLKGYYQTRFMRALRIL